MDPLFLTAKDKTENDCNPQSTSGDCVTVTEILLLMTFSCQACLELVILSNTLSFSVY